MKKMHWLGVIATSLISASTLAGCSGDDPLPAGTAGTGGTGTAGTGTGGTGGTAGTGTAGSGGSAGTGGSGTSTPGVQLQSPAYHVMLSGADATPGAAAPAVYATTLACAGCHGDSGQGAGQLGPDVRFVPADYAKAVIRGGRTGTLMVPYAASTLSDADLDAVIAWMNGLPKPMTGEGLYKAMCGNCHGPTMPTGGSAPINIQGASIANVDKFVREGHGTDIADRKEYMPKYDTTLLTDAELTLIKTFIGAK